jgi:hypothetical protein
VIRVDMRVLNKLKMDHLNSEEKTSLGEICFDYHDVFSLQGGASNLH